MTNDKLLANRRNALLSTGPRSAGGLARASKNALAHGLYSAAVVPALGETAADLADLCAEVRAVLRPDSLLEARLCDRVALLILRLGRVARFEAAAAARNAGAALAAASDPDPDVITGAGVDICRPPHPGAPAARLAFARARIAGWTPVRDTLRAAAAALAGGAGEVGGPVRRLVYAVGEALELDREAACSRWAAAGGDVDAAVSGDRFRELVRAVASGAPDPEGAFGAVRGYLAGRVAEYDRLVAEMEGEADALATGLRAARNGAAAAAAYGDPKVVDAVVRLEGHLTRQLGLALDLLDRLRGGREGDGEPGLADLLRGLAAR